MILDTRKENKNPLKVSVNVSSATYKGALGHTVNAGLQFMVLIALSFIFKMSLCSLLAAPSCLLRTTIFEQTEKAVK